jgi:hypothetical protein
MNGVESYLTDNLFKNICEAYPCVFNLNYLLTGEGDLLTVAEDIHTEDLEKMFNQQPIDYSSLVNAALAAKDETIRALEGSLRDKERIIQLLEKELKDLKQNVERQRPIGGYPDVMGNFASEQKTTKNDDL